MTLLVDFVKNKEFGKEAESFAEGETILEVAGLEVEETTVNFDGKQKTRYLIKDGEKRFWSGPKVMKGLKKAIEQGATKVKVIRQGQGKESAYIVSKVE